MFICCSYFDMKILHVIFPGFVVHINIVRTSYSNCKMECFTLSDIEVYFM